MTPKALPTPNSSLRASSTEAGFTECADYISFLRLYIEFALEKKINRSFQSLAVSLGISPGLLSEIVKRRKHLKIPQALRLASKMELPTEVRRYFVNLAKSKLESHFEKRLQAAIKCQKFLASGKSSPTRNAAEMRFLAAQFLASMEITPTSAAKLILADRNLLSSALEYS
jgi:plasmid maintenance system antidote protein VapI